MPKATESVLDAMVATENSYFVFDGVCICSPKGRPPASGSPCKKHEACIH